MALDVACAAALGDGTAHGLGTSSRLRRGSLPRAPHDRRRPHRRATTALPATGFRPGDAPVSCAERHAPSGPVSRSRSGRPAPRMRRRWSIAGMPRRPWQVADRESIASRRPSRDVPRTRPGHRRGRRGTARPRRRPRRARRAAACPRPRATRCCCSRCCAPAPSRCRSAPGSRRPQCPDLLGHIGCRRLIAADTAADTDCDAGIGARSTPADLLLAAPRQVIRGDRAQPPAAVRPRCGRHDRLHLREHRRAEGRSAHLREPLVERGRREPQHPAAPRGPLAALAPALARRRTGGRLPLPARRRRRRHRREGRAARRRNRRPRRNPRLAGRHATLPPAAREARARGAARPQGGPARRRPGSRRADRRGVARRGASGHELRLDGNVVAGDRDAARRPAGGAAHRGPPARLSRTRRRRGRRDPRARAAPSSAATSRRPGVRPARDAAGWFHTGDLGRLDAAGRLIVTGRRDTMFISGGENIHPEEIEREILRFPGVLEAIVAPVPDPEFGARPVAFLRTADGSLPDASGTRSLPPADLARLQDAAALSAVAGRSRRE